MRKVIIGILMFFCLLGVYQSLWANHSMHPLKQIAFVKKMIERQQEPYHTAYVQLIRYADSIQHVTCLLYTSPGPRDRSLSRMPSSA